MGKKGKRVWMSEIGVVGIGILCLRREEK